MDFYDYYVRQNACDNLLAEATVTLQQKMIILQSQIYSEQYYVNTYKQTLQFMVMTEQGVTEEVYNDEELAELCNAFWEVLPDIAAIRRKPFFLVCDIAEHIFD